MTGTGDGRGDRTPSQGHGYVRLWPSSRGQQGAARDMERIVAWPVSRNTERRKQLHGVGWTVTGYNTVDGCPSVPFHFPFPTTITDRLGTGLESASVHSMKLERRTNRTIAVPDDEYRWRAEQKRV